MHHPPVLLTLAVSWQVPAVTQPDQGHREPAEILSFSSWAAPGEQLLISLLVLGVQRGPSAAEGRAEAAPGGKIKIISQKCVIPKGA